MTIYFITPDFTYSSGGVRVIYLRVNVLNEKPTGCDYLTIPTDLWVAAHLVYSAR